MLFYRVSTINCSHKNQSIYGGLQQRLTMFVF